MRSSDAEITLALPDLLGEPPARLSPQEMEIVKRMRERAETNLEALLELLRHAELGASRKKIPLRSVLMLLKRKRKITVNIVDPETGGKIRMSFSLPTALFQLLRERPIGRLLYGDSQALAQESGVSATLIRKLKKDLVVVKIVLAFKGVAAEEKSLLDFAS